MTSISEQSVLDLLCEETVNEQDDGNQPTVSTKAQVMAATLTPDIPGAATLAPLAPPLTLPLPYTLLQRALQQYHHQQHQQLQQGADATKYKATVEQSRTNSPCAQSNAGGSTTSPQEFCLAPNKVLDLKAQHGCQNGRMGKTIPSNIFPPQSHLLNLAGLQTSGNTYPVNEETTTSCDIVMLTKAETNKRRDVFICEVPSSLQHGHQVHIITPFGQIYTTTVSQLTSSSLNSDQIGPESTRTTERAGHQHTVRSSNSDYEPCTSRTQVVHDDDAAAHRLALSSCKEVVAALHTSSVAVTNVSKRSSAPAPPCPAKKDDDKHKGIAQVKRKDAALLTPCNDDGGDLEESQEWTISQHINSAKLNANVTSDAEGSSSVPASVDGISLEQIKEFAKAFKMKRLSLGLTQTQVGQSLSISEGPAYSQSAICRFEKLDITPKSAQKIQPVLQKWMQDVEERFQCGKEVSPDMTAVASVTLSSECSKKRKRRTSFTPQALEILNEYFEKNTHPAGSEMTALAEHLNYDREVVRVWFCNKRQALKNTIKKLKQTD